MADRREDILWVQPHPTPTSVTVNGAKNAMDIYMKECCLEFMKYTLEKMGGHSVDGAGNVEVKWNGTWITLEQLFENFL